MTEYDSNIKAICRLATGTDTASEYLILNTLHDYQVIKNSYLWFLSQFKNDKDNYVKTFTILFVFNALLTLNFSQP